MTSIEALAIRPHDESFTPRAFPVRVAGRAGDAAVPQHLALRDRWVRCSRPSCSWSYSARRWAGTSTPIDGVTYGQFIVAGLLAQAILSVGFVNGTTSLFEARHDKYIHDVFASPLRWWEINAALVTGGIVRGIIVGAGVLAIARAAAPEPRGVARPFVFGFGTLGVLLVAAQVGVIAGSLAKSLDHVYSMESIILLPLGSLGGVFYSVQQLPHRRDVAQPHQPGLLAGAGRADRPTGTRPTSAPRPR